MIAKLDKNGNRIWIKIAGGAGTDSLTRVVRLQAGGYIACGKTFTGKYRMQLIRFTETGNIEWMKEIGHTVDEN